MGRIDIVDIARLVFRETKGRRTARLSFAALAAGLMSWAPGLALAAAPPLPTCAQLGSSSIYGLVGNPQIVARTVITAIVPGTQAVAASPPSAPTPTPATPAYCQVNFTFASGLTGPKDGYDVGQAQMIKIEIVLPLSAADGGVTGSSPSSRDGGSVAQTVAGNWLGKLMVSGSMDSSGTISWTPYGEGLNNGDQTYPIRLGYVSSMTDTGQSNPPWVLIPTGSLAGTLARGTIADWAYRGTHYGKEWATTLSKTYYGSAPTRTYYNGVSGGGNMGMGQLMHYGNEYDGILVGAPAFFWGQFTLADIWPYVVFKKMVQQGGTMPTSGQEAALQTAIFAECDKLDGVVDGIINDPRACTFKATANICGVSGAPASPNCLSSLQATAFDTMWEGPRNHFGQRIWYPYDKSIPFSGGPFTALSTIATSLTGQGGFFFSLANDVIEWTQKNASFDPNNVYQDKESLALAGNPAGGVDYEDEATLGANTLSDYTDNQTPVLTDAVAHGTKVIHLHGTADPAIFWRTGADYYRRVATWYSGDGTADFKKLQSWYRFFPMPGVGHGNGASATGSVGPSPDNPFPALVNWVENRVAPNSLLAVMAPASTSSSTVSFNSLLPAGSTRPLCPFPQKAIYKGTGSSDVASNFMCGDTLETVEVTCGDLRTLYKHENGPALDFEATGVNPQKCLREFER
ncbi:MAG TPA: tannase/feruloyl esterase family alpha/beta hydrolase [Steroidobacteraceae bacterium]|nr:tannase/feruloyl esterase family alpha/beta hydrolase [Steroidobacteraceae bacterium]